METNEPQPHERLPPEIWGEIGKRLKNQLDLVRFRSTCNSWRSNLLPASNLFPLRIPSPPGFSTNDQKYRFFITERTGFLRSSGKKPMAVVFESIESKDKSREGSGVAYTPTPLYAPHGSLIKKVGTFPKVLDMQQCSIDSLFTSYFIRLAMSYKISSKGKDEVSWDIGPTVFVDKVVLIPYDSNANVPLRVNPNYTGIKEEIDLIVVALMSSGDLNFLSTRSMEWTPIIKLKFDDIVNYKANLWTVDQNGTTYIMDFKSVTMRPVVRSPNEFIIDRGRKRLVEASGELYMLVPTRDPENSNSSNEIKIFQLLGRKWVEVKSIGKHVFFVFSTFSFSTIVDIEGRGNCIVLDSLSFCRYITSRGCVIRDYPLFRKMRDVDYGFGVYDVENKIGDNKFKGLNHKDLHHILCSEAEILKSSKKDEQYVPKFEIPGAFTFVRNDRTNSIIDG
ncbi:F-box protein SKIP23-like [Silene latifolia]|uniref:F-box protein SKIP23-like n=1 Tax=Silene latifolia TaxID=37657 RepID=UPI003D774FA4